MCAGAPPRLGSPAKGASCRGSSTSARSVARRCSARVLSPLGPRAEHLTEIDEFVFASSTPAGLAAILLLAVVLAPLVEELLFRGLLYTGVRPWLGPWPAMAITAVLFAAMHGSWRTLAGLLAFGLVWAGCREATGSLAGPMVGHAVVLLYHRARMEHQKVDAGRL